MADETPLPNPLTVDFLDHRRRTFKTAEQVQLWAQGEIDAWTKFQTETEPRKPFSIPPPAADCINLASLAHKHATQFIDNDEPNHRQNMFANLSTNLNDYAAKVFCVSSKGPIGKIIIGLADDEPDVAVTLMAMVTERAIPPAQVGNLVRFLSLVDDAKAARNDGEANLDAHRGALDEARGQWMELYRTSEEELQKQVEENIRYRRKALKRGIKAVRDYEATRRDHEEQLATMRVAFSTEMRLRASEKFWDAKRKINARRATTALAEFIGGGVASVIALSGLFIFLADQLPPAEGISPMHLLAFGAPVVFVLWMLRILATRYRTNTAMADDAEERMAMVKTFKALEYEEKVSDEERIVILQALFRPHDRAPSEGVPNPVWEAVIKRVGAEK